jgi:hypothetical protein
MAAQDFATARRLREEQTSATEAKSSFKDAKEVDWEVLPPGWWRDSTRVKEIRAGFRTKREADTFIGRLEYVDGFGPLETWESKFAKSGYKYYIFVFRNHAVAECPQYGNAAYVLTGASGWKSVFSKSRQELRADPSNNVTRVRHTTNWKARLAEYLN